MTTLTKNVQTRYTNLKAARAAASLKYRELVSSLRAVQDADSAAAAAAALKAHDVTMREIDGKIERMRARHGKSIKVSESKMRSYDMTFKYPRDGMGRLHLHASNLDHSLHVSGCGYDKMGAVLGNWVNETFADELAQMNQMHADKFYGLVIGSGRDITRVHGACGRDCVESILKFMGFDVRTVYDQRRNRIEAIIVYPTLRGF